MELGQDLEDEDEGVEDEGPCGAKEAGPKGDGPCTKEAEAFKADGPCTEAAGEPKDADVLPWPFCGNSNSGGNNKDDDDKDDSWLNLLNLIEA